MKIDSKKAHEIFEQISSTGELGHEKAVLIYSKEVLQHRLKSLKNAFPAETLHAVAIKTNCEPQVLAEIVRLGYGLEAASIEEMWLAKEAGIVSSKLVFDSPVKTREEIEICHEAFSGALVNANSLQELDRYPDDFNCRVGLRINPLVKSRAKKLLDVSNAQSKFGVPIDQEAEIVAACLQHKVVCLHMHIGSGLNNFKPHLTAIKKLLAVADKINKQAGKQQIHTLDIGGGLHFDTATCSPADYATALATLPGIDQYQLITEFGAYVHTDAAFAVSFVEYVIPGEPDLAFIHLGADMFLRKVYADLNIDYPISVVQKEASKEVQNYQVVGPLCFGGDVLFESISLPKLKSEDIIFIHNVGANTSSMWSKHCSRTPPPFYLV